MDESGNFHRGLLVQPNCTNCPLRGERIVPPEGNPHAKVAIVGEAPGTQEVMDGRPFIGPTGQYVDKMLSQIGTSRFYFWITNAALCKPKTVKYQDKLLNADQALRIAAEHCRPRLLAELRVVNPKVVLGFGAQSVRSVYDPKSTMKGRRGGVHVIDLGADSALPPESPDET